MISIELHYISSLNQEAKKYKAFLSKEEIEKTNRILCKEKSLNYMACKGKLREVLSTNLGMPPEDISFLYNEYGKPFIQGTPLHFNCSHSFNAFAICISSDYDIGIDIEHTNLNRNINRLVSKVLSQKEMKLFEKLKTAQEKSLFFYKLWTLKESITKENGTGIIASLNSISPIEVSESLYSWEHLSIHHKYINEYSLALAQKGEFSQDYFKNLEFN